MSSTFGALSEVKFMHAICRFKTQEVNNPMLQTVCNSELKWRSYSHCKPITPSWRKNFERLQNHPFTAKWFRSHFAQCYGIPPEVSCYLRRVGSWTLQAESQLRSAIKSAFCCEVISQPFLCVCEISQTSFSPAKWSLVFPDICAPTLLDLFLRYFCINFHSSPCNPPTIRFLS